MYKIMKAKINMLGIMTSQLEVMRDFYRDVMGFKIMLEMEGGYVEFENEGVRFALSTHKVMAEATGHPSYNEPRKGQSLELAFVVDSPALVDETYNSLVQKGATPIKSPEDLPWQQRAAFFADPDGNIHEIFADIPK